MIASRMENKNNLLDFKEQKQLIVDYHALQTDTLQFNTMQYNTIQYNTIQYNTIQYSTI